MYTSLAIVSIVSQYPRAYFLMMWKTDQLANKRFIAQFSLIIDEGDNRIELQTFGCWGSSDVPPPFLKTSKV